VHDVKQELTGHLSTCFLAMLKAMKQNSVQYSTVELVEDWTMDSRAVENGVHNRRAQDKVVLSPAVDSDSNPVFYAQE